MKRILTTAAVLAIIGLPIVGVSSAYATEGATSSALPSSTASNVATSTTTTSTTSTASTPPTTAPASTATTQAPSPSGTANPVAGPSSSPSTPTPDPVTPTPPQTSPPATPVTSPSSDPASIVCLPGTVNGTHQGAGQFTASTTTPTGCGIWVTTFLFDGGYIPTSTTDYQHPQTAKDWAWVVLTSTPQKITTPVPACGPYQADLYYGAGYVAALPAGELGSKFIAGGVTTPGDTCAPVIPPKPDARVEQTTTRGTADCVSGTVPVTLTTTTVDFVYNEAKNTWVEGNPVVDTSVTYVDATTTECPVVIPPAVAPPAVTPPAHAVPTPSTPVNIRPAVDKITADAAPTQAEPLAYTGSEALPWITGGSILLLMGVFLKVGRRVLNGRR